jgi:signal transduction histidine kinase
LRRVSESAGIRPRVRFGLRPRLLAAFVLTAAVTLGAAAIALLAPLQSRLNSDAVSLTETFVEGEKTSFSIIPAHPDGTPNKRQIYRLAHQLGRPPNLVTVVIWSHTLKKVADTHSDKNDPDAVSATLAREAFRAKGKPRYQEVDGLLEVAARYKGHGTTATNGPLYVLEVFKPLDYVGEASGVVQSAFLEAALVGLVVAIVLGIGFSSRLLRRLRLLQDASRTLDERDLSTLVVPHDTVSDEIGELARGFATMHARLRQQEDARRAFVATASHELRTPLTSLDGMLELLADDLDSEPIDLADARERVARAQQQSRRLASLASDLLDLSRLDALVDLRSEPVELGETARAVAAEFDSRARARGITLVLDQADGQSWAQADPGSVARIVRILLDNALRVAPAQTTIEIRIDGATGKPTIEVADAGPGVADDERELIFERFQRGRGRSDEGGFGLGLAIGSELATRMGGTLELTDARPGAIFRLRLSEVPH